MNKNISEIKDLEIKEISKKVLLDKSLEFITKWYTCGMKNFNDFSNIDKKNLRLEVRGFDESEVAEFSASSLIEEHHNTILFGSNVGLSGNKNMRAHGVDLIHIKNDKIIFIEVKGAQDNKNQTKSTLVANFKNAQKQLLSINAPEENSRFRKVLKSILEKKENEIAKNVLENLLDFESGDAELDKNNFELLATVVYPKNNFSKKFSNNLNTKQFLIEIENRGKILGEESLTYIDEKITKSLEKNENNKK